MGARARITGLAAAAALAFPAAAAAQGPVAFQGDPAHTGTASGTTFSAPLGKRWVRRALGESPTYPVLAEGRVFLTAGSNVYALDRATGRTIWSRAVRARGVAYDDGKVFLINQNGVMQALRASNGSVLWSSNLPGESSFLSPPVAFDGYVHASSSSTVFGVNQDTGLVLWSTSTSTGEGAVPAIAGNNAYTSGGCGEAAALERRSGTEVWNRDDECSFGSGVTPVVTGGQVFAGGTVFDALTGLTRDTYAATTPPAFAGGVGYFVNGPEVYARDSSGIVRWRYREPGDSSSSSDSGGRLPPFVAGNHVYVVSRDGKLVALARASGRKVWESDLRSGYSSYSSYGANFGGIGAAGNTLVVSVGERVVAYSPGPDTPGVDDPDKPAGSSSTLQMGASAQRIPYGRSITLSGQLNASGAETRQVQIQHDPWPFGSWQHLRTVNASDDSYGDFSTRVKPRRNTRYRAVFSGTHPAGITKTLTIYTDWRLGFRIFARSRRKVLIRMTAVGPKSAKLRGARMHVYHFRARARSARRIGVIKLRGKGTRVRGRKVMRTPTLRRTDLFFTCRREKRDDGFGRPDKRLRLCGRKRLR